MNTLKLCPKCGRPVIESNNDSEVNGYQYQCLSCDEDFWEFEVTVESKTTFDQIKEAYTTSDVCMGEMLASTSAHSLTIEEAFELYIEAMKWAEGDRFYKSQDNGSPIEL